MLVTVKLITIIFHRFNQIQIYFVSSEMHIINENRNISLNCIESNYDDILKIVQNTRI